MLPGLCYFEAEMCGFVGTLKGDRRVRAEGRDVEAAGRVQVHRGPDRSAVFAEGPFAAAHQRLRILDLSSAGDQPMLSADGAVCIVYNGEVYNFRELRERYGLDRRGFRFRSSTDTEVLLYLYELLGIDFVQELNGMYAIAIWDRRCGKLFLIRDRFGIKPLFYTLIDNDIWFASEIKALLQAPGFDRQPCLEALHHYLSFNYIPGDITAFEGVREVRPGRVLEVSNGQRITQNTRRYWSPRYGIRAPSDLRQTVDEVRSLLQDAVVRHMISDVPVGVMLSGGMDSSVLAALMAQGRQGSDFHTFAITFDDPSFDESSYAATMARHLGTSHHEIRITPRAVADSLETALSFIDEPYADGSAIPTYLLAKQARDFVTVLLSGEGGDEVFVGYDTHVAHPARNAYRRFPCPMRRLAQRAVGRLPVSHKKLSLGFKLQRFVHGAEASTPVSHFLWRRVFSEAEKREILAVERDLEAEYGPSRRLFETRFESMQTPDVLNRLLALDCAYHLPDDLMIKNDRMTMASSIEARVPFLDLPLFEYMSGLAGHVKMRRLKTKYLLKEAMAPWLPTRILKKKKVGLELPYSRWFCSELKPLLLDVLSPASLREVPLLNGEKVHAVLETHLERQADRGRELWGLLNFVTWYRQNFSKRHVS